MLKNVPEPVRHIASGTVLLVAIASCDSFVCMGSRSDDRSMKEYVPVSSD